METILSPAIRYAREGFPVSEVIAYYWRSARSLSRFPNISETYMPEGAPPAKGEIFRNPYLANTLEKIAAGGKDVFYKGEIARTIDQFMKENGGFLSYEDLANHSSEWVEQLKPYLLFTLRHLMSPRSGLKGPPRITLARWDKLNLQRRVVGIGGADAHEHISGWRFISVRIFPYKLQFKAIRTHVLLDKPLSPKLEISKRALYEALVSARAFVSNFRWGDARGFRFWASHNDTTHQMGARVPYQPGMRFHIQAPKKAKITLLRNGLKYASTRGRTLTVPVDAPGAYRVEIRRWYKAWIFSNHIVILDAVKESI